MSHPRILLNLKKVGFSLKGPYPRSECGPRSLLECKERTLEDVDFREKKIILENFRDWKNIAVFQTNFEKR
jgi:hypothetical protein